MQPKRRAQHLHPSRTTMSRTNEKSDRRRDPLFLFVCHLEWHTRRNIVAYQELIAALDDPSDSIRVVAEVLLSRSAPRPEPNEVGIEVW